MTEIIGNIIVNLVADGYQVDLGPHVNLSGFYCAIFKEDDFDPCPECGREGPTDWKEAGHGQSLFSAVLNAQQLLYGVGTKVNISEFE